MKYRKSCAACEAKQIAFVPLSATTLGAWHPTTTEHLRDFARLQTSRSGGDKGFTVRHLFECLTVSLSSSNVAIQIQ
jgi:hypothetical protein